MCRLQLAGRPVPDLCRHLGLTAGVLPASVAPARAAGTVRRKRTSATSERRRSSKASKNCAGASSNVSSSYLPDRDAQVVAGPGVVSTAPSGTTPTSSSGRSAGSAGDKGRPGLQSVVLLPRRRIFYSSSFVRSVDLVKTLLCTWYVRSGNKILCCFLWVKP